MRILQNSIETMLPHIRDRQLYAVQTYGQAAGDKMTAYAKKNAPWTDRTHTARNTISSSVTLLKNRVRVNLESGVRYGVCLEYAKFAHRGRLSVWWPTVEKLAPDIVRAWAERVRK